MDIVLVLDVSGSMDDSITSYTYTEVSSPNQRSPYYIYVNGEYKEVQYRSGRFIDEGWYYQSGWSWTKVDTSTTFYDRSYSSTKKIEALKDSVDSLLDYVSTVNAAQSDTVRVSIIQYADDSNGTDFGSREKQSGYNKTQILTHMTNDVASLKEKVKELDASGSTAADYGMNKAYQELFQVDTDNVRSNSSKVVIMFTDGEPNHYNGFDGTVANDTITTAKSLKDNGVKIYTVGVFGSSIETDLNNYMNAVSSNYPNAISYTDLGEGSDKGYYKTASNAADLESAFHDIIYSEATTVTTLDHPLDSSDPNLYFTDVLGDYVEVDTSTIKVGDETLTYNAETGTYNATNGTVVAITTDGNGKQTVRVTVPETALPMVDYNVATDGTITRTEAAPIRISYKVKLKDNVEYKVTQSYIENNSSTDGSKLYFYSNDTSSVANVTFTASESNPYYKEAKSETVAKSQNITDTNANVRVTTNTDGTKAPFVNKVPMFL